jgi:hypothetical protein
MFLLFFCLSSAFFRKFSLAFGLNSDVVAIITHLLAISIIRPHYGATLLTPMEQVMEL